MFVRPRNALPQAWPAIAFCMCVAACSTMPDTPGIASVRDAQSAVVIGKSTKADVEAALGKAIVVAFDSGYEVWVYREKAAAAGLFAPAREEKAELVLLFEPAGVLKKSRVRPISVRKRAVSACSFASQRVISSAFMYTSSYMNLRPM